MTTRKDQRGVVLPSPVVLLSIVAVVMAGIAFFVTRGNDSAKVVELPTTSITPTSTPTGAATDSSTGASVTPTPTPTASATPKPKPVKRSQVKVVVFNNTRVKGLAATVSSQVTKAGWRVVGADNWYGSIPKTTVYYPAKLKDAAKLLALDLGIKRLAKAQSPMSSDRLTLILTGPLS
ncbi:LytR C-terminal domain-containing protein [Nocardioides sp.]|uniref:LytR C-terminal domain-containing protein n=1 Tax=Nocardioides sp. TaxID=35761 RepID=UPI0026182AF9|nr:LytR C-terminal domain-containing protein [Nocardioides sp.]